MVFNEISLLTGFYWLERYKNKKFRLNLETGMEKKRHGKHELVNLSNVYVFSLLLLVVKELMT